MEDCLIVELLSCNGF